MHNSGWEAAQLPCFNDSALMLRLTENTGTISATLTCAPGTGTDVTHCHTASCRRMIMCEKVSQSVLQLFLVST